MGERTADGEHCHALWLLWGGLTDWVEVKPEDGPQAEAAMRRAATEWLAVADDEARWRPFFDHWLYTELGYERPAEDERGADPLPPIVVAEGWNADFFATQQAIGAHLEPWFVEESYQAWDATGRPLDLVLVDVPLTRWQWKRSSAVRVDARLREPTGDPGDACAKYLREWLIQVGAPSMPEGASLSDLLVQALIRGDVHR